MAINTDKRKYLQPEMVAVLNSMALRARLVVEGYIIGQHRSPYHGFSVEFAEHRAYGPGDEIRHIDWKLFGKTERLYVKRYEEETNLRAHIILDTSRSMLYKSGKVSKLNYANSLAASLSYLMINQQDAAGLIQFSNKIDTFIPPKSKPSHLNIILTQLDDHKTGEDTKIETVLHQMAERIDKRGIVILISDLLDDPVEVMNGLKHFRHKQQEVIVFHILDPKEITFDFKERIRFRDLESKAEIITDPRLLKKSYQENFKTFMNFYKKNCGKHRIDYIPISTDQPLDTALTEYLVKRKKLN